MRMSRGKPAKSAAAFLVRSARRASSADRTAQAGTHPPCTGFTPCPIGLARVLAFAVEVLQDGHGPARRAHQEHCMVDEKQGVGAFPRDLVRELVRTALDDQFADNGYRDGRSRDEHVAQ